AALLDLPQQIMNQEVCPKPGHVATPKGDCKLLRDSRDGGELVAWVRELPPRVQLEKLCPLLQDAHPALLREQAVVLVISKLDALHERRVRELEPCSHR